MRKKNKVKNCWGSYGTPGAGADFLSTHKEVEDLWQEYIFAYEGMYINLFLWFCSLLLTT